MNLKPGNNSIKLFKRYTVLLFMLAVLTARAQEEAVTVTGNELIGRDENGVAVREVNGNVVMRQGNVTITCNRAIQYLAANNAHLIGNVVVTQDTLTIRTPEGYYYGNEKRAYSDRGVTLDDKKVTLKSLAGEYFFKTSKADFRQNVSLKDNASVMYADRLLYFRRENRAVAYGNVRITDDENEISADSLTHLRAEEITNAYGNIQIKNLKDKTSIYGNHVSDYRRKMFSIVDENPLLVQADTVWADSTRDSVASVDTLIIKSERMEADRSAAEKYTATDSVRILRGVFCSRNDKTVYSRSNGEMLTYKLRDSSAQPVLWYEQTQLTGDSMLIHMKDKKIESADIFRSALILSQNPKYPARYDQVAGETMKLHFRNNKLNRTDISAGMLSYYYMYDDDEKSGIVKASAMSATIVFDNNKVEEVHLFSEPKTEFHPENLVEGKERQFTLPQFRLAAGKPDKITIFKNYINKRFKY